LAFQEHAGEDLGFPVSPAGLNLGRDEKSIFFVVRHGVAPLLSNFSQSDTARKILCQVCFVKKRPFPTEYTEPRRYILLGVKIRVLLDPPSKKIENPVDPASGRP